MLIVDENVGICVFGFVLLNVAASTSHSMDRDRLLTHLSR